MSKSDLVKKLMQQRKKNHKVKVRDLSVVSAVLPEGHCLLQALEEAPKYLCSCGAHFHTNAEADQHLEDAKKK